MPAMFILLIFFLSCCSSEVSSQQNTKSFKVLPLGIKGGLDESNLSAYMIAAAGTNEFVCVDAGTIRHGIDKALQLHSFTVPAEKVLKDYIRGYLISHAHLDHVAGLVMNSPDDGNKNIYAFPFIINTFQDKYFNWQNWANFGNAGDKPVLNKYKYITLKEGAEIPLDQTTLTLRSFVLSHANPYQSSAFLIQNNGSYLLYLGDTGADSVEHSNKLGILWQAIAPIVKNRQLKGIFIEVSFPNEQPDGQLFGHLTPKWFMKEMTVLGKLTGEGALKKVSIFITHIKPAGDNEARIRRQLIVENKSGLRLRYPVQGKMIIL